MKGVVGDNLHKIGAGTLNVNVSQGNNLKTGDGLVVLNSANAFDNIYMASGHGVVKLIIVQRLTRTMTIEVFSLLKMVVLWI